MTQSRARLTELTRAGMVLAVIIVLAFFPGIPVGILPAPLVLQNAGVMLAGELLGVKTGTLVMTCFFILVAIGMPFLTGGAGGVAVFFSASAGYLVGWLFAPAIIAWIMNVKEQPSWLWEIIAVVVGGVLFINLAGSIGLVFTTHISNLAAALIGSMVYIPGDLLKAILCVTISQQLHQAGWR